MRDKSIKHLPFCLSIGPQRAGTSWLDRYLRYRGDVCLPAGVKEIFFFDRHYQKGSEFYFSHFEVKDTHKVGIEFTTTSFDDPKAPKRVLKTLGEGIKLLCPLRDPITRSYSLYRHYKRYGIATGSLQDACAENPQILTSSHYADHLTRWFDVYSPEKIHIQFQENLNNDQDIYVRQICEFLELPYKPVPEHLGAKYNATTKPRSKTLAKAAQNGADLLRGIGLYAPINLAKKIGLKEFIFGAEGRKGHEIQMSTEESVFLHDQLDKQRDELTSLLLNVYKKPLEDFLS